MSAAVTIREHVLEAIAASAPHGLTMAAIAGAVKGPWREQHVTEVARKLWGAGELARRQDGTFVRSGGARRNDSRPEHVQRSQARLQAAVRTLAAGARRDGFDAPLKVRKVDPALLSAFCPACRELVHPRLDGTCVRCGTQTGANLEVPQPPPRHRRRRPLRKGQAVWGPTCPRCGGRKGVQSHMCHRCGKRQRGGYNRGKTGGGRKPRHVTEEQLEQARRLYLSGLSLREVAARLCPETGYKTASSCAEALYGHFRRRGWKLRPQRQVTAARNHKHGRKKRGSSRQQERAYRYWLAAERGWSAVQGPGRPACRG
jgi:transposase